MGGRYGNGDDEGEEQQQLQCSVSDKRDDVQVEGATATHPPMSDASIEAENAGMSCIPPSAADVRRWRRFSAAMDCSATLHRERGRGLRQHG